MTLRKFNFKVTDFILPLIILVGVFFQGVILFKSGILREFGVGYWGPMARDGVWHEALIRQLSRSVPPVNPGLAGVELANYHYFYDLLVAFVTRLGISTNILIYKIFPVIFSILLGIGTYKLSLLLFKDLPAQAGRKVAILSVFFAYFASSFGWVISLIKHEQIGGESAFWANQPVSMNINPPYAISLVIIIFTMLLVNSYIAKPKILKALLVILLAGSLIGFKVYAGVILLAGLFVLAFKRLYIDKDYKLITISIISLFISLAIILPQAKSSVGIIQFQPFWLIDTMIDAGDRVGIADFTAKRFAYLGGNQWGKLILLETLCFLIFFIGNMGTRIIGIFALEKKQFKSDLFILIFSMMIPAFILPLLFVQKGNPWNIVQFFYYFLFFAGILAAYGLRKVPFILALLIILITPISSVATFRSWLYPNPPAYLPIKEYEALNFLSHEEDGVVLKHQFDKVIREKFKDPYPLSVYADNTYVSAYSGKSVFLEDVEQQIVLNTDYKGRLEKVTRFFVEKDLSWSVNFLKDNNISYLYLPKIYQLPVAQEEYPMKKIFENEEVYIYKVLH